MNGHEKIKDKKKGKEFRKLDQGNQRDARVQRQKTEERKETDLLCKPIERKKEGGNSMGGRCI